MRSRYIEYDSLHSNNEERYSEQNQLLAEALEMSKIQVQELSKQLKDCNMELLNYKLKAIRSECAQNSSLDFLDQNAKKEAEVEFEKINHAIIRLQHILAQLNEESTTEKEVSSVTSSKRSSLNHSLTTMKSILDNLSVADTGVTVGSFNNNNTQHSFHNNITQQSFHNNITQQSFHNNITQHSFHHNNTHPSFNNNSDQNSIHNSLHDSINEIVSEEQLPFSSPQPQALPSSSSPQSKTLPSPPQSKTLPSSPQSKTLPSSPQSKTLPSSPQSKTLPSSPQSKTLPSSPQSKALPSSPQSKNLPLLPPENDAMNLTFVVDNPPKTCQIENDSANLPIYPSNINIISDDDDDKLSNDNKSVEDTYPNNKVLELQSPLPIITNLELKLDTIVPDEEHVENSRPRRGASKKAIFYKEPSIRTKLRRGDVHTDDILGNKDNPNFIFKNKPKKYMKKTIPRTQPSPEETQQSPQQSPQKQSKKSKQARKRKVVPNR